MTENNINLAFGRFVGGALSLAVEAAGWAWGAVAVLAMIGLVGISDTVAAWLVALPGSFLCQVAGRTPFTEVPHVGRAPFLNVVGILGLYVVPAFAAIALGVAMQRRQWATSSWWVQHDRAKLALRVAVAIGLLGAYALALWIMGVMVALGSGWK